MKKIFYVLIVLCLLFQFNLNNALYASSFFDLIFQNSSSAKKECPYCHYLNPYNAKYCAKCGRQLSSFSTNQYSFMTVRCPYCHHSFQCSEQNSRYVCQNCGTVNSSENIYCYNCGCKIDTNILQVHCPYCRKYFIAKLYPNSLPYIQCPVCHKWYRSNLNSCPFCINQSNQNQTTPNTNSDQTNAIVKIDSFTKADYNKKVKKYTISPFTSGRSYSKVIINNHITLKYAVIVNTIKVRVNGGWQSYHISSRLKEGQNVFNVSIPQGAQFLVISFTHGKGSQITVYLE